MAIAGLKYGGLDPVIFMVSEGGKLAAKKGVWLFYDPKDVDTGTTLKRGFDCQLLWWLAGHKCEAAF